MKVMFVVGGAFLAAGVALIVAVHGPVRFVGVLLVVWGLGTVPVAMRLRQEGEP